MDQHDWPPTATAETWTDVQELPQATTALAVLGLGHGFESAELAIIAEPDILGDRLVRRARRARRAEEFISEVSSLAVGDIVVHIEHGIGR